MCRRGVLAESARKGGGFAVVLLARRGQSRWRMSCLALALALGHAWPADSKLARPVPAPGNTTCRCGCVAGGAAATWSFVLRAKVRDESAGQVRTLAFASRPRGFVGGCLPQRPCLSRLRAGICQGGGGVPAGLALPLGKLTRG